MAGQGLGPLAFKPDATMSSAPGAGRDSRNPPRDPALDRDAPSYGRRTSPSYLPEVSHRRCSRPSPGRDVLPVLLVSRRLRRLWLCPLRVRQHSLADRKHPFCIGSEPDWTQV